MISAALPILFPSSLFNTTDGPTISSLSRQHFANLRHRIEKRQEQAEGRRKTRKMRRAKVRYSRNGQRRGRAEKRRKERERKWANGCVANGCEEKKMARRDVSKLEMPSSTRRVVEHQNVMLEEKWKEKKEGEEKKKMEEEAKRKEEREEKKKEREEEEMKKEKENEERKKKEEDDDERKKKEETERKRKEEEERKKREEKERKKEEAERKRMEEEERKKSQEERKKEEEKKKKEREEEEINKKREEEERKKEEEEERKKKEEEEETVINKFEETETVKVVVKMSSVESAEQSFAATSKLQFLPREVEENLVEQKIVAEQQEKETNELKGMMVGAEEKEKKERMKNDEGEEEQWKELVVKKTKTVLVGEREGKEEKGKKKPKGEGGREGQGGAGPAGDEQQQRVATEVDGDQRNGGDQRQVTGQGNGTAKIVVEGVRGDEDGWKKGGGTAAADEDGHGTDTLPMLGGEAAPLMKCATDSGIEDNGSGTFGGTQPEVSRESSPGSSMGGMEQQWDGQRKSPMLRKLVGNVYELVGMADAQVEMRKSTSAHLAQNETAPPPMAPIKVEPLRLERIQCFAERKRERKPRVNRLLDRDCEFCEHMIRQHGENYEAMSRDPKNVLRDPPAAIQRKLRVYREFLKYQNEMTATQIRKDGAVD